MAGLTLVVCGAAVLKSEATLLDICGVARVGDAVAGLLVHEAPGVFPVASVDGEKGCVFAERELMIPEPTAAEAVEEGVEKGFVCGAFGFFTFAAEAVAAGVAAVGVLPA